MNALKKKSLHVAVVAGLAAVGAAGTAEAVHINPDGTGQVLVFPYYTARGGQFTAISIINSQGNTKMVKVRFLEGKNSREVLDFNLFLSPADVWTGAVVATANGAKIITSDNSCVTPSDLFVETRLDGAGNGLNDFKNYQYTGGFLDAGVFGSLDRTREGYFEVIEMGVIDDNAIDGDAIVGATAIAVTGFIKHNSVGVPANCAALNTFDNFAGNPAATRFPNTATTPANSLTFPPRGGLAGRASIINPATGANYTFSPTAFDAWSVSQQYTEAGNLGPTITSVDSGFGAAIGPTSNVFTSAGIVTTVWDVATPAISGRNAMSATMMRNSVMNEFILDAATVSQTDWVVTFPTKRAFVTAVAALPSAAVPPFANNFPNAASGACDPYGVSIFNREEQIPGSSTPVPNPSPLPPGVTVLGSALCWEANVVPFQTASLLGSTNSNALIGSIQTFVTGATSVSGANTSPAPIRGATQGPNGYMFMNFTGAGQTLTTAVVANGLGATTRTPLGGAAAAVAAAIYQGMPVIGMMLHNYQNTGVVSRYGGVVPHNYTRNITP